MSCGSYDFMKQLNMTCQTLRSISSRHWPSEVEWMPATACPPCRSRSTLFACPGTASAWAPPPSWGAHRSQHIQCMSCSPPGGRCGSRVMASKSTKLTSGRPSAHSFIALLRPRSLLRASSFFVRPVGVDTRITFTSFRMLSRYCIHSWPTSPPFSRKLTAVTRMSFSPAGIASRYAFRCVTCHVYQAENMLSMATTGSPAAQPGAAGEAPKKAGTPSSTAGGFTPRTFF
mmetsp:Transcript_5571/g.15962  ORF Transcript_5571/g.15962 Transcript_5571/m.15962 type:complete len:230 (+) Transcript_5571:493-1182(+)